MPRRFFSFLVFLLLIHSHITHTSNFTAVPVALNKHTSPSILQVSLYPNTTSAPIRSVFAFTSSRNASHHSSRVFTSISVLCNLPMNFTAREATMLLME